MKFSSKLIISSMVFLSTRNFLFCGFFEKKYFLVNKKLKKDPKIPTGCFSKKEKRCLMKKMKFYGEKIFLLEKKFKNFKKNINKKSMDFRKQYKKVQYEDNGGVPLFMKSDGTLYGRFSEKSCPIVIGKPLTYTVEKGHININGVAELCNSRATEKLFIQNIGLLIQAKNVPNPTLMDLKTIGTPTLFQKDLKEEKTSWKLLGEDTISIGSAFAFSIANDISNDPELSGEIVHSAFTVPSFTSAFVEELTDNTFFADNVAANSTVIAAITASAAVASLNTDLTFIANVAVSGALATNVANQSALVNSLSTNAALISSISSNGTLTSNVAPALTAALSTNSTFVSGVAGNTALTASLTSGAALTALSGAVVAQGTFGSQVASALTAPQLATIASDPTLATNLASGANLTAIASSTALSGNIASHPNLTIALSTPGNLSTISTNLATHPSLISTLAVNGTLASTVASVPSLATALSTSSNLSAIANNLAINTTLASSVGASLNTDQLNAVALNPILLKNIINSSELGHVVGKNLTKEQINSIASHSSLINSIINNSDLISNIICKFSHDQIVYMVNNLNKNQLEYMVKNLNTQQINTIAKSKILSHNISENEKFINKIISLTTPSWIERLIPELTIWDNINYKLKTLNGNKDIILGTSTLQSISMSTLITSTGVNNLTVGSSSYSKINNAVPINFQN